MRSSASKASPPSPSVSTVAEMAQVSLMTVSRVFRNSPRVSPATRDRVLAAAKTVGYRRDPQIARLMELVRSHRLKKVRAKLAVIRDDLPDDALHAESYHYMPLDDIRHRADQHGYEVEELHLGSGKITPGRLGSILRARGIGGVLVSVQSSHQISARMDYSDLAAVTFGYGLGSPGLHRAGTNMMEGILSTMALLELRGYRRIGMAISPWIDARANHTYSGALLHHQQTVPTRQRVPLLLLPHNLINDGQSIFCEWIRKWRPDVIISFHSPVAQWLRNRLGLRIPGDIGLVAHDWMAGARAMESFAGIDHQRAHVAAAGVDLVATQLQHHEHGVPSVPRQILIPPRFVDGPSIRSRP